MKKYLFIIGFLLASFVSYSQVIPKPNPSAVGIGYKRLLADSTIFIPTGGAIPRLGSNNINRRSAIYADTINKKLYVFYPNDSAWKESGVTAINWDSVFNKPTYFKTKYDSSTDIRDSIQARLAIRDTANMLSPYALLSEIPSLSGYVQGSGTTNYISKFTGSGTIGNSALQDDGTNIGLGTAPTGYYNTTLKLGTGSLSTGIAFTQSNFLRNEIYSYNNDLYLNSVSGGVNFATQSSNRATINNAGRFLLGATDDGTSLLQVGGAGRFTGGITSTTGTFSGIINGTTAAFSSVTLNTTDVQVRSGNELRYYRADNGIYTRLYDGGSANGFVLDNRNGDGFNFQSAGTSQLRIASTGAATFSRNDAGNVSATLANAYLNQGNLLNFQQNKSGSTINAYIGHGGDNTGNFIVNNGGGERMTITPTGNVGLGATNPLNKLVVASGAGYNFEVGPGATTGVIAYDRATNVWSPMAIDASKLMLNANTGNNVLIGTSTDNGSKLQVNGTSSLAGNAYLTNGSLNFGGTGSPASTDPAIYRVGSGVNDMAFATGATERMRITSGGKLAIGMTSADYGVVSIKSNSTTSYYGLNVYANTNDRFIALNHTGSVGVIETENAGSGVMTDMTFKTGATERMRIRANGELVSLPTYNNTTSFGASIGMYADGTFYRSTSSLKYKKDVNDAWYGLPDLMKLRAVTYKSVNERDGDLVFGGLIAEEVDKAGLKEFVVYAEDGTPDSLQYGNMVSLLVKAIQELKAEKDALEARLKLIEQKLNIQ